MLQLEEKLIQTLKKLLFFLANVGKSTLPAVIGKKGCFMVFLTVNACKVPLPSKMVSIRQENTGVYEGHPVMKMIAGQQTWQNMVPFWSVILSETLKKGARLLDFVVQILKGQKVSTGLY